MKKVCPQCNGQQFLKDLTKVQPDLHYPEPYDLRDRAPEAQGQPPLSCDRCKGQGWIDEP